MACCCCCCLVATCVSANLRVRDPVLQVLAHTCMGVDVRVSGHVAVVVVVVGVVVVVVVAVVFVVAAAVVVVCVCIPMSPRISGSHDSSRTERLLGPLKTEAPIVGASLVYG